MGVTVRSLIRLALPCSIASSLALSGCIRPTALAISQPTVQYDRFLALNGHPLELHLAECARPGDRPLLLYATGDGGWRGKDIDVYRKLVSWGYPTVAFSSPQYLKHLTGPSDTTTPGRLARDYDAIAAFGKSCLMLPADTPVVLVGVSRGADLAVIAAGQGTLRHEVCGVVAVGLTKEEEYVRWFGPTGFSRSRPRVAMTLEIPDYLPRLSTLPVSVIQSTHDDYLPADEARALLGSDTERRQLHSIVARNHSFADAREALYEAMQASLAWVDRLRLEKRP